VKEKIGAVAKWACAGVRSELDPPIIVGLIAASRQRAACVTYNSYQTELLLVPPRRDESAHLR